MATSFFFKNIRAKKSVLKRTRPRQDLPLVALYLGELVGQNQRKLLTPEGEEKVVPDKIVESNFKQVSGPEAEELLSKHWPSYLEHQA